MDRRLFALALITAVLYAPTVNYPYVYEDKNDLEAFSRPWPLSGDVVGDALRHPTRLLRDLSFAIGGTNPRQAHVGNVVLHLANGVLVFALASSLLSGAGALFAAGVFWLHPVQVESVAYISSRADLVATFFLLVTLLVRKRPWWALVSALACVFSKETYVMVLIVPIWYGVKDRVLFAVWMLAAIPTVMYGLIAFGRLPELERAITVLTQLSRLLLLFLFPWNQTIDHDWGLMNAYVMLVCLVAWIAIVSVAVLYDVPYWSIALLAILLFFLPRFLIPLSEGLHEHHLYAPSIAASLWAGNALKGRL